MRKGKFSQEQIIAILREQGGRHGQGQGVPPARDLICDILRLEIAFRRARSVGSLAAEDARGREPQAEEAISRAVARQRHP